LIMCAISTPSRTRHTHRLILAFAIVLSLSFRLFDPVRAESQQQKDIIRSLAWSPDGKLLASGSENGQVSLWDAQGQLVQHFPIQQDYVVRIVWSPNNQYLLSWSTDDRALLWKTDGRLQAVFEGCDENNAQAVQWSPDGDLLAVSPKSAPLQIWRTVPQAYGTGSALLVSLGLNEVGDDQNLRLAWSPDGSLLAAGHPYTNIVYVWRFTAGSYFGIVRKGAEAAGVLTTLQDLKQDEGAFVERLAWSADSSVLAVGYLGWTLQLWPRDKALQTLTSYSTKIDGQYDNVELAWSPDGSLLAFGDRYVTRDNRVQVRLWSRDGQPVETIEGGDAVVVGLAWSPQQVLAIAYNAIPALSLWSPGQKVRSAAPTFDGFVWGGVPEWSFDGAYLAMRYDTVSDGARIQVWTATGAPVAVLSGGNPDDSQPFAWSPTGNVLALRAEAGGVRLVDAASLKRE
jgi:WD40 repeat protein